MKGLIWSDLNFVAFFLLRLGTIVFISTISLKGPLLKYAFFQIICECLLLQYIFN